MRRSLGGWIATAAAEPFATAVDLHDNPRMVRASFAGTRRFAFLAVCCAALWTLDARAEDRTVLVPETSVRSAPFDVAPEIARLRAGDRVSADEQAQGTWRRVALPDGRHGFVHDADTQHAEPLPASAPPAADAD